MVGPKETAGATLRAALASARLLVFDVDGVLTDRRVIYGSQDEVQAFDVRDGLGLELVRREGLQVAWISGRGCAATRRRAAELGVRELHLQTGPKGAVLRELQARLKLSPAVTVSMGDDLPDLPLAALSALFVVPADAHPEARARAGMVCAAKGGRGAVRELCDAVLRARGSWPGVVAAHENAPAR
jgi:3-deoxy-D-manno-octulosonate 8-phosphate phosphatase (KDO 8-P phosphatase)